MQGGCVGRTPHQYIPVQRHVTRFVWNDRETRLLHSLAGNPIHRVPAFISPDVGRFPLLHRGDALDGDAFVDDRGGVGDRAEIKPILVHKIPGSLEIGIIVAILSQLSQGLGKPPSVDGIRQVVGNDALAVPIVFDRTNVDCPLGGVVGAVVEDRVIDASVRLFRRRVVHILDLDPGPTQIPCHIVIDGQAAGLVIAADPLTPTPC